MSDVVPDTAYLNAYSPLAWFRAHLIDSLVARFKLDAQEVKAFVDSFLAEHSPTLG